MIKAEVVAKVVTNGTKIVTNGTKVVTNGTSSQFLEMETTKS